MATAIRQPEWQQPKEPADSKLPPVRIYNSLTRSKNPFYPINPEQITWYACGPTVYDDAHLGHARNYVSTDIIRRVLRDYFKFKVRYIQNVTDVDDKIILRARQKHLINEFNHGRLGEFSDDLTGTRNSALRAYLKKNLPKVTEDTVPSAIVEGKLAKEYSTVLEGQPLVLGTVPGDKEAKMKMHIRTALAAARAMHAIEVKAEPSPEDLVSLEDVLMPYLDDKLKNTIDSKEHSVFTNLTQFYEKRYTADMRALNVLDPDEITRVTEYGKEIVAFVERIEQNKFAYTIKDKYSSNKSVYFDIKAFEAANNSYARLEPWNRNDTELLADGEGALSKEATGKRSAADFALWKASKAGEPSWPSPWGEGRPGWHIECSAMASDKLGRNFDIHSGGIDLAFPHHDNELAQSEAYWNNDHDHQHQWVNYFLHMGHLSIAGSKMSKSLKNFTTIKEALDRGTWTPRGLRIVFLLGGWREGIEITDAMVKEGSAWEDRVNNFFIKAKDISEDNQKTTEGDQDLLKSFEKAKNDTFAALCDSFDTPTVMRRISELISDYNIAYNSAGKPPPSPSATLNIARWMTSLVNTFGLNGAAKPDDPRIGWSGIDVPEDAKPILTSLSRKRDSLRRKARSKGLAKQDLTLVPYPERTMTEAQLKSEAPFKGILESFNKTLQDLNDSQTLAKDVLQLTDRLRDTDLWDKDVYLEDRDNDAPALIRPVTRELRAAREEKERRAREKEEAKLEKEQAKKEEAPKTDKGEQNHRTMFRTEEYSAWDADGIPTQDKDGEELTKSRRKKLAKDWEKQKKAHEAFLAKGK